MATRLGPSLLSGAAGTGTAAPQLVFAGGGTAGIIAIPVVGVTELAGLLGLAVFSTGGASGSSDEGFRIEDGVLYENGNPLNPNVAREYLPFFERMEKAVNKSLELARELGDTEAMAGHMAELQELEQLIAALRETIR